MKKVPLLAADWAPIVVLVRPQLAENIGMAARAMMNCGLTELRLVGPREPHLSDKAVAASSGAQAVLENARVFDSLPQALADVRLVLATTARRRDMTKPVHTPSKAVKLLRAAADRHQKAAVLFGAERTGLENDEIVSANGIIEIPLNPKHRSLNLSQAVLIVGYEWFKSRRTADASHLETGGSPPAAHAETEAFLGCLEEALAARGYFRWPDKEARMKRNLRNIFMRPALTSAEIRTLHAVVKKLTS
ncbi:MAG: RNA methyltransferase [Alphaproteobacteria bacterium]|nr:RNA methyltransferase [Alphaproteobacteria bacterium]